MRDYKFVASRAVDGDVKKHAAALARAVTKYGAQLARRKIEDDRYKAGIVCPNEDVEIALGRFLCGKGWTVRHSLPKSEPKETQKEEPQEPPKDKTKRRGPHTPCAETLEAVNGARWGSDEMKSILESIGATMEQANNWADSAGHGFGFFRIDPWKAWFCLGGKPLDMFRDPQPKSKDVLKLLADKYGTECEAYKFYRLQSVGFRPELLKTKTKTTNRKAK